MFVRVLCVTHFPEVVKKRQEKKRRPQTPQKETTPDFSSFQSSDITIRCVARPFVSRNYLRTFSLSCLTSVASAISSARAACVYLWLPPVFAMRLPSCKLFVAFGSGLPAGTGNRTLSFVPRKSGASCRRRVVYVWAFGAVVPAKNPRKKTKKPQGMTGWLSG